MFVYWKLVKEFNKMFGVFHEYREFTHLSRSFPRIQGIYPSFQEFSTNTGNLSIFPGVFHEYREFTHLSRSFPGIPGVLSTMILSIYWLI